MAAAKNASAQPNWSPMIKLPASSQLVKAPTSQAARAPAPLLARREGSVASLTLQRRGLLVPALEEQSIEGLVFVVQALALARETL